jgi:hypothetical protein
MQITARTASGDVTIRAGEGFERHYTWDGATRSAVLWPRTARGYGSLGIYLPGPGEHWKPHSGITRGVLEEGVLWFKTVEDALSWIQRARTTGIDYTYNDHGLVVGFGKIVRRRQVNVAVWQMMVAGEKPQELPGSSDGFIKVTANDSTHISRQAGRPIADNSPTTSGTAAVSARRQPAWQRTGIMK